MKDKALFLDRDGVINIDHGYTYRQEDFEFCDGIFEFIRYFSQKNYKIFVVTNQSGISRGYYSHEDFAKLTEYMVAEFAKNGIKIEEVAYCPHHPDDGCLCRKPKPKMIDDLVKKYNIDRANSVMIGDKQSDIDAAKSANIKHTILTKDLKETLRYVKNLLKNWF